jgi:hypothetical protein
MATASRKVKQPPKTTGSSKAISKEKANLRRGEAGQVMAVRPMVPDDVNNLDPRPYDKWKPGSLRPFVSTFRFNLDKPSGALPGGPGTSVGGRFNGISTTLEMRRNDIFGSRGQSKK